ncbi:MAG: SurA N-terminal domain-containing protein [Pseudolabrys sp.]
MRFRYCHMALRGWLITAIVLLAGIATPHAAFAQVVVIVNGTPITALDIERRTKLNQLTGAKSQTRQQILNELIDDKIKLSVARRNYSFEIGESDIDEAYGNMARRTNLTPEQMGKVLSARGIGEQAFKAKLRADMTWSQLVRGKFNTSLQVGDSDVANALRTRKTDDKDAVGYTYKLYPVIVVVPAGSGETVLEARRREAENLRSRFLTCADGLKLARALRDVAVREPISRSAADVTPQLRELLDKLEVGRLTTPEPNAQGLQMFALCEKKEAKTDSPAKREVRDELFNKRFEAESKKFLDELRKQAMIEYR